MRLAVVGNPANRRVALFAEAVARAGLPAPEIHPWRDVLRHGRVPGPGVLVRIDSPGEDAEVDLLLRELGSGRPSRPAEHGEILGTAAAYAGLRQALSRISGGGGALLSQADDVLTMTDKPRCHALLAAAGIPVPAALGSIHDYASLRAAMREAGWGRVFVKPAYGSSASGVLALAVATRRASSVTLHPQPLSPAAGRHVAATAPDRQGAGPAGPADAGSAGAHGGQTTSGRRDAGPPADPGSASSAGSGRIAAPTPDPRDTGPAGTSGDGSARTASSGRVAATTSVELQGGRLFNSLRVRRYEDEASVAAIVDRLAPDGLHVERWFPKAGLGGRTLDLRVVVIAGRARHIVVRTSRSPMTNLHLGNARGDVASVRAAAGEQSWRSAMETCERVAACFPRTLHVGVDLMFRAGWRDHAVAEVNAFGDLLPGVLADGSDTYGAQVAALIEGWVAHA
ncbi:STM4014 family protein [Actinoplanes sp. NPDC024001]|uniref:STM4014 family protein n=1 Tax=Actinoplanes sp. NPDC024001 TaxID=3154598 RepID=UPI0033ECA8BF